MTCGRLISLERIAKVCANARNPSQNLMNIYDITMQGLGLTAGQRELEIQAAIQRKRDRRAAEIAADVALQGSAPWS